MTPEQLSRELRLSHTPDMERRRTVVGLSMVGVAAGAIVSLYQTGILPHLPDLPGKVWDADKVDWRTPTSAPGRPTDSRCCSRAA